MEESLVSTMFLPHGLDHTQHTDFFNPASNKLVVVHLGCVHMLF